MSTDNIKALIELFGSLGASSKEAFLWYLALDAGKFLISWLAILTVACFMYSLVKRAIGNGKQEEALKRLRDSADLGSGELSSYEIERVLGHYLKPRS